MADIADAELRACPSKTSSNQHNILMLLHLLRHFVPATSGSAHPSCEASRVLASYPSPARARVVGTACRRAYHQGEQARHILRRVAMPAMLPLLALAACLLAGAAHAQVRLGIVAVGRFWTQREHSPSLSSRSERRAHTRTCSQPGPTWRQALV
jgi:hypothetical protein